MKSLLAIVLLAISSLNGVQKTDAAPCDRMFFHSLCNPKLNFVESCYDCYRLDKDRERCVPVFNKFDLTDYMSDKRWNCTEHVWENPFHPSDVEQQ